MLMDAFSSIGYGIIGTSDGFEAQTAGLLKGVDIGRIIDLDNRQLFAPAGTQIIAGIREQVEDHHYTYFVLYRYAVEKERSRNGGFYGSVVALKDCTADGFAIYNLLLELATNVKVYLDPTTHRFLVGMQEVAFLPPQSLREVIQSVKKTAPAAIQSSGYFAPLSVHARDHFRFIDFFQHQLKPVARVFASSEAEVLELVRNKNGLPVRKIQLEDAIIEQQLQQIDQIDTEIFVREKERESVQHQLKELQLQQEQMSRKKAALEERIRFFEKQTEEQKQEQKAQLDLAQEVQRLHQEKSLLEAQLAASTNAAGSSKQKSPSKNTKAGLFSIQHLLSSLHPIVRLGVLLFVVLSLATLGYFTTTAFGAKPKKEVVQKMATPNAAKDLLLLEQTVENQTEQLNIITLASFMDQLSPHLNDPDTLIQQKAKKMQRHILQSGRRYYQKQLQRTDSIPVLHSQLVGEFEVFKQEYDSLLNFEDVK